MASDGQWYAPELHPDEAYRDRWTGSVGAAGFAGTGDLAGSNGSDSVVGRVTAPMTPPLGTPAVPSDPMTSMYPSSPPTLATAEPPTIWPPDPPPVEAVRKARSRDVIIALSVLGVGLLLVLGTFLSWVEIGDPYDVSIQGWDRDDGPITLVAGLAVAGLGGLIGAGVKHVFVKLGVLLGGFTALAVFVIDALDVSRDSDDFPEVDISMGVGLWLIGICGVALVVLALLERSPWGLGGDR